MFLDALRDVVVAPVIGIHVAIWLTLLGNVWYLRRHRRRAALNTYPSVSICIPARNEADNVRRLIPSLLAQQYAGDVEILILDDGSDDGTWDVLQSYDDPRLTCVRGNGPPPGWLGKVHALYQLTRRASGDRYLFLDADAALTGEHALTTIVERTAAEPDDVVATALPRLRGAATLLVSLVPNAILTGLPWPLVRRLRIASLGAVNGQCWTLDAAQYHAHEPHEHVREEVLEDVEIGRYLKRQGLTPVLLDLRDAVSIYMYDSFAEAWNGFRKNAYLILGGSAPAFVVLYVFFLLTWTLAPLLSPWLLASVYGLKLTTDRIGRFPWTLSVLAPLSYLLGSALQLDSALHHWTGTVSWKGRRVGASTPDPQDA